MSTNSALSEKCAPGLRCELHTSLLTLRCDKHHQVPFLLEFLNDVIRNVKIGKCQYAQFAHYFEIC